MESLSPASVHPPIGVGFFLGEGRTTSGIFASRNCSAGIFFREHEFVPRENSAALPLSIDVLAEQGRSIGHSDFTAASDRKRHATTA